MSKRQPNGRKRETEFRGLLALLIVVLTFGLAYIRVLKGDTSETLLPPWAGVILGAVVSMYFQSKGGEVMRRMTQEGDERKRKDKQSKENPNDRR